MQLALSFSTLLASVLVVLSATDSGVQAAPAKRARTITLPLTRLHQNRGDVHPQVLLQQHINRSQRRIARMKGVAPPSKRDLEHNLAKRLFIPPGGRPGTVPFEKRFNRQGAKGSVALVEDDDAPEPESFAQHGGKATKAAAAAAKKGKGKGAAAGNANSTATAGAAASASNLTPAEQPTASNSLGLAIEAQDVGYIATIQMGTPARDFNILMDSGSADLWVGAENCQSESGGDCGNHNFLGTQSSSSFKDLGTQFQVTYGTGNVQGDIIQDDISVAGLALPAHTFGVATAESVDFSDDSVPFDGLMGLAQSTLSEQGVPTPVEALSTAGLIGDAITSFKISRLADDKNDGEITFGGLDDTKFDSQTLVTFDNVATNGFWEGAMDAVTVDGQDTGLSGRSAILDTGTTLIVAPPADATAVHQLIDGAQDDGQGGFTIPCNTNASVALTFSGQQFAIDTRDLVFAQADNTGTTCVSGISSGQIVDDTTWLVGDVFLKNAYFSTDVTKNQISLAKLV
ncbi:acid protease [Ganoderma leucocontextum]|nr:acid protease [Ganoderma leucocontextum]